jgi:tetratricopeptide (TPR) repeat protein
METKPLEVKYRQADIAPFWEQLPFLFAFPLRPGPLVFMACIVGASLVAGAVLGAAGLLFKGILVYLGLRYGFNVLDLFAKGRFETESVDRTLWGGSETRPAKLGLVIVLFIVLGVMLGNAVVGSRLAGDARAQQIVIERWKQQRAADLAQMRRDREAFNKRIGLDPAPAAIHAEPDEPEIDRAAVLQSWRAQPSDPLWWRLLPAWYWAVMVALSLMLPSAAIVVALEDAFFKALNPAFLLQFLRTMGGAYFVLWGFLLAIAGARQLVLALGARWPAFLRFPVEMALGTYLGLVLCALIGYVVYQYHQELHLDVEVDFDTHRKVGGAEGIARAGTAAAAIHQALPQDPRERKVQALVAQGKISEAIEEVKDEMRYDRLDPELNTRLHDLYKRLGNRDATLAHGQQWLNALVRAGRHKEGVAALRALQRIDAGFVVAEAGTLLPLAGLAAEQGERETALNLLRAFIDKYPLHARAAEVRNHLSVLERMPAR